MIEQVVRAVIARMEEQTKPQIAPMAMPTGMPLQTATQVPAVSMLPSGASQMITTGGALADAPQSAPASGATIPVEMSARHVHLCREDLQTLFGVDALTNERAISQPGQFLSTVRVRLIGPKGVLDNVAVLGPTRNATQVEVSATDARQLGVKAPVNLSGDLSGAANVCIQAGEHMVQKPCAIIARRHVHMTPQDAATFGVHHGQEVALAVEGKRPLVLLNVPVRVSQESALALHIDTDEANAAGAWGNIVCRILPNLTTALQSASATPNEKSVVGAAQQMTIQPEAKADFTNTVAPAPDGARVDAKLICERDVLLLAKQGAKSLCLTKAQLITPLAVDTLKASGITLIREG